MRSGTQNLASTPQILPEDTTPHPLRPLFRRGFYIRPRLDAPSTLRFCRPFQRLPRCARRLRTVWIRAGVWRRAEKRRDLTACA